MYLFTIIYVHNRKARFQEGKHISVKYFLCSFMFEIISFM